MKNIFKILTLAVTTVLMVTACTKVADLPYYDNGTAVVLTASKTSVAPTPADSLSAVISFSWTSPEYKQDTTLYKFILEIDSTGRNFAKEATKIVTGVLTTSLTGKELNTILLNYGFSLGVPYDLDVRVTSSYGNNNERYLSNVVKVSVTPYNDPAVLTTVNTSVTCALATSTQLSNTFNWSNAFNGYTGNINYVLQYDSATKNFVAPLEIPVGTNLYTKALTQGEMNETALTSGIPGGNTGKVEYRIKATTAQGAVSYSNVVNVTIQSYIPILRFYLPGSYQAATGNGNNWDPGTAPEFIRDLRAGALNKLYYMYIYLPAGAEFKVTQGRSWDVNYGGTAGVLSVGGANFTVATAGYYRISIDRTGLQYDIREGRMGFVGGGTGAGWDPPSTFPNYAMGAASTNLFVGLTDFTVDGWKLIDNNQWNSGDLTVVNTRSYGAAGGSGSTMEINGGNFPNVASAGRYRVMWDGRDVDNIKYEMSPATEMRVVGDGMQGVNAWDPGASPQMTYNGNGVWSITLTLVAGKDIKFLAGNAWGAFDYEDNSGGSTATGTPRKIKWEGGDNFKTPATTGSYTITLNEYTQTVTIN
ncbi:MAG: SusE domain-containing protein [Chitinophagaceae bacterium]|nr:SusE domain-containing protein [Chitinophagaceae bacterium]HQV59910.1 SusE domain-containing protein [Chitinophagaceae bacterium]HQV85562.1 SusE domain-containing protein [Chitinophagaceae bacterium]HQX74081.1 SusE domain-containing protein [Chitinophagaceae bacterium]HQZ74045.1 SusE domain-containing protein [Chitinophagaceae bacterium]